MFKLFNALIAPIIDIGNATSSITQVAAREAAMINGRHKLESIAEIATIQKQLEAIDKDDFDKADAFLKSM